MQFKKGTAHGLGVLFIALALCSCGSASADDGSALVTASFSDIDVWMVAERALFVYDNCFENSDTAGLLFHLKGGWFGLRYQTNQNAAIQAAYPLRGSQAGSMACFGGTLGQYGDRMGGRRYIFPLGKMAVRSVAFVNAFSMTGSLGSPVNAKSYKVAFGIRLTHPTGQGSLPPLFNMTCVVANDPVQNKWTVVGCK